VDRFERAAQDAAAPDSADATYAAVLATDDATFIFTGCIARATTRAAAYATLVGIDAAPHIALDREFE
jgi:hypothetical protein